MTEWYHRLWQRDGASGFGYRALTVLLTPAEGAYRAAVSARSWAYDRGVLKSASPPIPTLIVGNLTVGGSGKTPMAAWIARRLEQRGRRPSIVMRGYGDDESDVHRLLNPSLKVYVSPDRVAGVRRAYEEGCDVAVLDDAFQHRAIRAHANIVLVAAEDFSNSPRLLPRGPWRETLKALRRATLVITTRKTASRQEAERVSDQLSRLEPALPQAQACIAVSGMSTYDGAGGTLGEPRALERKRYPLAVAGVAKPETVWAQLREAGLSVGRCRAYPDHHRYTREDVEQISREAAGEAIVATLKDAVKLGPLSGSAVEIHVPLQQVILESGDRELETLLANLLS
ncbi:MAG: hypothetical protein AMS21_13195 [Gemmatimonas sp. SG8_38_2]|nr:MAG: hypothetical protein AMS21_13195 [Gemmatimonas sp. SG8_38_2]